MAHYAKESADSRLLIRNSAETLSVTFYSGETATDADGSVTVGITDEAGATVVASGATTTSIVLIIRTGQPNLASKGNVHYQRITGMREEKLRALTRLALPLGDASVEVELSDWMSPLVPDSGGDPWRAFPLLADLLPWQQPGCKFGRTWPISPSHTVLTTRWSRFLSTDDHADRAECFYTASSGRTIDTRVTGLPVLAELPIGRTSEQIARYAYRSFDRQWAFSDPRLAKTESPSLWSSSSPQQLFLTSKMSLPLGKGPAAVVTSDVPDLHYFCGRGGKDIIPLYRDAAGTPNVAADTLSTITTTHQANDDSVSAITPESLFCYAYGILAGADYTDRFAEALETPGPRVPLTADPNLFAEVAAHGEYLLWLHTYGERLASHGRPDTVPISDSITWGREPSRIPENSRDFSFDSDKSELHVADGVITGVGTKVWAFEVSGMQIVKKWLGYRTAKGAGRAASSSSPLDHIRPTEWLPEWSEELLELLTVLDKTLDLLPRGIELLDRICDGPLIAATDLPPVPDDLRKPPKVIRASSQLTFGA